MYVNKVPTLPWCFFLLSLTQQQYLYIELFEHDTDIFDTGKKYRMKFAMGARSNKLRLALGSEWRLCTTTHSLRQTSVREWHVAPQVGLCYMWPGT